MEKILCAAIYLNNGKTYKDAPENISEGIVISGWRHGNCFSLLFDLFGKKFVEDLSHDKEKLVCGFLTSQNRFVNRKEGYYIAKEQNQLRIIHDDIDILTSEDLY